MTHYLKVKVQKCFIQAIQKHCVFNYHNQWFCFRAKLHKIINLLTLGKLHVFLKTYLDLIIFVVLGLMSLVALTLIIERFMYLRQVKIDGFASLESLEIALTKNFAMIASIAANAPYVGLLGTVFGIMVTFYDLGQATKSIQQQS